MTSSSRWRARASCASPKSSKHKPIVSCRTPRASTLATNFASHWLHLQNLGDIQPDIFLYPDWDYNLTKSMRQETLLFFDSIVREDRNILDLLTADYTFVDQRLAHHYEVPSALGNRFRRVGVEDDNRRGLLGHASILTLTSLSNRTSPVIRGAWIMDVLLGTPPPRPPANVPSAQGERARVGACSRSASASRRTGRILHAPRAITSWTR